MPRDALSEASRHLGEAFALLDFVGDVWKDDLSLQGQAVIASEHVKLALDALGAAEDLLRRRQADQE
jgi:hypothetical protein